MAALRRLFSLLDTRSIGLRQRSFARPCGAGMRRLASGDSPPRGRQQRTLHGWHRHHRRGRRGERRKTLFYFPHSSGAFATAHPCAFIQIMPSKVHRRSCAVGDARPRLGGYSGPIRHPATPTKLRPRSLENACVVTASCSTNRKVVKTTIIAEVVTVSSARRRRNRDGEAPTYCPFGHGSR